MVKNIVFDMGGVLIDFNFQKTLKEYFPEKYHEVLNREVFMNSIWQDLDGGFLRSDDAIQMILPKIPEETRELVSEMVNDFYPYMPPFPQMYDFIKRIKTAGYPVYLLSNAQRLFTESELKVLGIYDLFDGIYISSDKGVKKPSPEFMEMLLKEYNLDKSKSIMIGNDCSSDIAVANACGMDSLFIHANISPPLPKEIPATYAIIDGDFRKVSPLILK